MTTLQIPVDDALKQEADGLFASLGLDTPTVVCMFLKEAVDQGRIPFFSPCHLPTPETLEALEDARLLRNLSTPFSNGKDAVAAMLED